MYQNYQSYYNQNPQMGRQQTVAPVIPPQTTNGYSGLKGRPVSSLEEVRAISVDFDGSVFFFPDLANKRIYTKQINIDGTATLNMYELKNLPTMEAVGNYITREEFENALGQIKGVLNSMNANASTTPTMATPKKQIEEFSFQ